MRDRRPPEELTPAELLARMKQQTKGVLKDCEQAIADGEYWMRLHPDEEPLDLEWFKLMANQMRRGLRQIESHLKRLGNPGEE